MGQVYPRTRLWTTRLSNTGSFTNHFTGKPEGTKTASGSWSDLERSLSSRKFELSSFVNPSPSAQQSVVPSFDAEYKAFGTSFGIEIEKSSGRASTTGKTIKMNQDVEFADGATLSTREALPLACKSLAKNEIV